MGNMGTIFPEEGTDGSMSQSARDETVPEGGALVCKVEESEAERRGPMVNSNSVSASAVTVATPIIGDTDEDDGDDEDDDDGASDSDTKAFPSSWVSVFARAWIFHHLIATQITLSKERLLKIIQ